MAAPSKPPLDGTARTVGEQFERLTLFRAEASY
jgi:hypothetical protein